MQIKKTPEFQAQAGCRTNAVVKEWFYGFKPKKLWQKIWLVLNWAVPNGEFYYLATYGIVSLTIRPNTNRIRIIDIKQL